MLFHVPLFLFAPAVYSLYLVFDARLAMIRVYAAPARSRQWPDAKAMRAYSARTSGGP